MSNETNSRGLPLAGIRVLDMSQYEAGAACTEVLAWLGADVVKVENPKGGDPGRRSYKDESDADSWYFLLFNANKKSITIDAKSPDGLALIKSLAAKADIFVENFAPGVIERLGLGPDVLREINPRLIYSQIKGFGRGSANEQTLAFDMIAQAAAGLTSITGFAGGPPVRLGVTLGDTGTGMLLAISILAALHRRANTGHGEHLHVAMQDAMLHYNRIGFSAQALRGKAAARVGNKLVSGANPPCGLYHCKPFGANDYICVYTSHNNPDHWRRVLEVIGRSDLIGDPRYSTHAARVEHEAEIDDLISTWAAHHDKYEAEKLLGSAGIPAGAVRDTQELHNDANFEQRGIMQWVDHPQRGRFKMPGWPVQHDGATTEIHAAPLLGENADAVLADWLGAGPNETAAEESQYEGDAKQ
ncbi:formyl-CoA transferase [Pollutimonas bauzanensis]|uniref:Formyl-CoA transferase n=1 Tax=Pollutimonas bauzanensis TaxID=658167 RepID=A0A1M5X5P0_9BURK|nr:formyl-CoA transferase [Pollutimonas bauzanensis]